jgi:hypothetical protein
MYSIRYSLEVAAKIVWEVQVENWCANAGGIFGNLCNTGRGALLSDAEPW